MITLYDNPFSPFARKVRLVLRYKGLPFDSIDALALSEHERLAAVNARAEVPILRDGDVTVVDSSDIVAYLEDRYPDPPVFPGSAALRAKARRWQRVADTVMDAIIHDISLWMWPTHRRADVPPAGLVEAGQRDLAVVLDKLEGDLPASGFVCGELSMADFALVPHVGALKPLGIPLDRAAHPKVCEWYGAMRLLPAVKDDVGYVKQMAAEKFMSGPSPYEGEKVVWRGDRIEWLFHHGFHAWWYAELAAGRVVVPSAV